MTVVVLGQIARDLVLVVDEAPGPDGSVDVRRRRELLGGKGANIAVGLTASRPGGRPVLDRERIEQAANRIADATGSSR